MEAMEFVAITMSRPGRDLKTGIALSSSFTIGWLSGRLARRRRDFVRLVEETHQAVHVREIFQRGTQSHCARSAVAQE